MITEQHESGNFESRLSRTQAQVDALANDVSTLVGSVEKLRTAVSDGFDRMRDRGRFDWAAMGTWAAIVMALVGLVGGIVASGYTRDIDRIDRGGSKAVEQGRADVISLDAKLQREMTLINETTSKGLEAAERRLEGDIAATRAEAEACRQMIETVRATVWTKEDHDRWSRDHASTPLR